MKQSLLMTRRLNSVFDGSDKTIYSENQIKWDRSQFMKQNADFQKGISQA